MRDFAGSEVGIVGGITPVGRGAEGIVAVEVPQVIPHHRLDFSLSLGHRRQGGLGWQTCRRRQPRESGSAVGHPAGGGCGGENGRRCASGGELVGMKPAGRANDHRNRWRHGGGQRAWWCLSGRRCWGHAGSGQAGGEAGDHPRAALQEMQGEREPGAGPWVAHDKTSLSISGGAGGGNPFPPRGRPSILLRAALLPQPRFRRNILVVGVGDAGEGVGAERGQGQARA